MKNWTELGKLEYDLLWDFVYETLRFSPSRSNKECVLFPADYRYYDISDFFGPGFSESLYDDLLRCTEKVFIEISKKNIMYALDWQHECYSFDPKLPFEQDNFGESLIPIFPNGDYLFFITKDLKNVIFADGINRRISFCGADLIKAYERHKPNIFIKQIH